MTNIVEAHKAARMNRVRIGILLMVVATLVGLGVGVAAAVGASLGQVAILVICAEVIFWGGVLLLGYSTYKLARAKGIRRVPAELWRLFRDPSATTENDRRTVS